MKNQKTNINFVIVDLMLGVQTTKSFIEEVGLVQVIINDDVVGEFSAGTEEQFVLAAGTAGEKLGYKDITVHPELSFVLTNGDNVVTVAIGVMKDEFLLMVHQPAADALGVIHANELDGYWLKSMISNELTREL